MKTNYVVITPIHEKDSDGYNTAIIALFNSEKDLEANKPTDAWMIDSYCVSGDVSMDFEFTEGIRMWASDRKKQLEVIKSYGPMIKTV